MGKKKKVEERKMWERKIGRRDFTFPFPHLLFLFCQLKSCPVNRRSPHFEGRSKSKTLCRCDPASLTGRNYGHRMGFWRYYQSWGNKLLPVEFCDENMPFD